MRMRRFKIPGQRIDVAEYNESVRDDRSASIRSANRTVLFGSPGGSAVSTPRVAGKPCFLVREGEGGVTLIGKEAFRVGNEAVWRVPHDDVNRVIVGLPWPGMTASDFKDSFLNDPNVVADGDIAVEFLDGYFRPLSRAAPTVLPVFVRGVNATDGFPPLVVSRATVVSESPANTQIWRFETEAERAWPVHGTDYTFYEPLIAHSGLEPQERQLCWMQNGYVWWEPRLKLVTPPAVEELCIPCQQSGAV